MPTSARPAAAGAKKKSPAEARALRRLGDAVASARTAAEMTQEALANAAGVSVRYLQNLEAGRVNPSWTKIVSVARALGRHGRGLLMIG